MIGLTRKTAVILSQCSTDNPIVNREMFTYVPPALTLENSTFFEERFYIFGMVLITKGVYLWIINLSVVITEEGCVLLLGHGSDSRRHLNWEASADRRSVLVIYVVQTKQ
jgi:hypothetical protein